MAYWKTQHFKALQAQWYERLRDSGFSDAEEIVGDDLRLRQNSDAHRRYLRDSVRVDCKADYYYVVSQHVHETEFDTEIDEIILTLYADGKNAKEICAELRIRGKCRNRNTIRYRIRHYEVQWGLRQWTPRQLNKKTA